MKKARNVVLALLCALLLIAGSVAGTLAYLTDEKTVTNTFTVGNVAITLDETDVTVYGVAENPAARVEENEYKLIPNRTYTKDPTIHVAAGSEDCWLFVKVENDIAGLEAQNGKTIAEQLEDNGWTLVTGTTNVYWHAVASAGDNVVVFEEFTIDANADLSGVDEETEVVVTAYAVQEDSFADAKAAWTATFGG